MLLFVDIRITYKENIPKSLHNECYTTLLGFIGLAVLKKGKMLFETARWDIVERDKFVLFDTIF